MKVLLVHNFYRSAAASGEDIAFKTERAFLELRGHELWTYVRSNDELERLGVLGPVKAAVCALWNPAACHQIRRILERHRPEVMHVHNTFPILSPAVFHEAHNLGIATVLTLHNYRIFCAAGTALSPHDVCWECASGGVLPALRNGCYRRSKMATLPVAGMILLHRQIGTWGQCVDAYIAQTDFQRDLVVSAGVPPGLVHVKPPFYPEPPVPVPWEKREDKVVFAGRLGPEKGVRFLIEAWKSWGDTAPSLEIVGDGCEAATLRQAARDSGLERRIRFFGHLPFSEGQARLARAKLLALPSICLEVFPMAIREAFALGVPVAASRLGSIASIVADGWNGVLFPPASAAGLLETVRRLWGDRDQIATLARNARSSFEQNYTPAAHERALMAIYASAIRHRSAPKDAGLHKFAWENRGLVHHEDQ